jgi:hypothetical protein
MKFYSLFIFLKKQPLKGCSNLHTSVVKKTFADLIQAFKGFAKKDDLGMPSLDRNNEKQRLTYFPLKGQ